MMTDQTASDGTLCLNTVNADVGTFSVLTVTAKGLVVAARALAATDVVTALGYTPFNANAATNLVSMNQFPLIAAANGCTTLPNGLMFQWGTTHFTGVPSTPIEVAALDAPAFTSFIGVAAEPVVFPQKFPHAVYSCIGTGVNNATYIEGAEMAIGIMQLSTSGVQFSAARVYGSNSSAIAPDGETGDIMWMAIGN